MRQQFFSVRHQTPRQRTERMKLNRQIRKEKLFERGYNVHVYSNQQCENASKQDKIHAQKIKNRQAAQKSREQKKIQQSKLQEEIRYLKEKIQNMRYCESCQKQLQIREQSSFDPASSTNGETVIRTNSEQSEDVIKREQFSEESEFIRMSSSEEHSSIGIYLFIFMIVLGVFCCGTRMDTSGGPMRRDLTQMFVNPMEQQYNTQFENSQVPSTQFLEQTVKYQTNLSPTYSTQKQETSDIGNKNGLLSMDQLRSPKLISDEKYFQKIITSFENYKMDEFDDKNLRSTLSHIQSNKSLLFCSRPKIYHSSSNENGILTAFMDIFVRGAEIINVFPNIAGQQSLGSDSLHLDGLYKITASVMEISEIDNQRANSAYE